MTEPATATSQPTRMSLRRRTLVAVVASIASVVIAAAFVRVTLDWSDAQPYDGEATELRYMLFATLAGVMAIGGTVASILWWWRGRRRAASPTRQR